MSQAQAQKKGTRQQVALAIKAVESKKGEDVAILEMDRTAGAFTDFFIVCSGTNPRQIQAIADEVEMQLSRAGVRPNSLEGYNQAEWVLLDYVDFVVHVFSERARKFYDLERLWKSARRLAPDGLTAKPEPRKAAPKKAVRKTSGKTTASATRTRKNARSKPRPKKPRRKSS
jgi:ribosome-associated protein